MRVAFFEDHSVGALAPLTHLRPAFELICGRHSLRERVLRQHSVSTWGAFLRPHLADVYRWTYPECNVNQVDWLRNGPTLLVNGRWQSELKSLSEIDPSDAGIVDGELAYLTLDPAEAALLDAAPIAGVLEQLVRARRSVRADGFLLRGPWELVEHNPRQLAADFKPSVHEPDAGRFGRQVEVLGPPASVNIASGVAIEPFVVLDARGGPISIEAGAVVQSFTRLEGPCHVGRDSQLFRANVRAGTTVGPVCRVGGEIEASILHSYVNKYHEGFLGHSYVCPWVNLGALSTNSDLKSDYSHVRMLQEGPGPVEGRGSRAEGPGPDGSIECAPASGPRPWTLDPGRSWIDTGRTKVGCFIGDHTKTAIGSLLNTGSSIGVMCMLLPAGELVPRHMPSFTALWHGELSAGWDLERSLSTARAAMSRRNCELSDAEERLLRHLYEATEAERCNAIERSRGRTTARAVPHTR